MEWNVIAEKNAFKDFSEQYLVTIEITDVGSSEKKPNISIILLFT